MGGQGGLTFDASREIKNTTTGAKYLVMTRDNANQSMQTVSPFLLKKVIDSVAGGEVEKCAKLRNGTVLIKTKSLKQAEKLITLTSLSQTIQVNVSEHKSLNEAKGVIYFRDLQYVSDEEILEELKTFNVIGIKRLTRQEDNQRKEFGLYILTFATTSAPEFIYIGYNRVPVRPFIPLPLRCFNCFKFGHLSSLCKNDKMCPNCANKYHLMNEEETCVLTKKCANCYGLHGSFDKTCPVFLKEKEIQRIRIIEKVDMREAIKRYKIRNPLQPIRSSFADAAKQACEVPTTSKTIVPSTSTTQPKETTPTPPKGEDDNLPPKLLAEAIPKPRTEKITILPKKTNKRQKRALKTQVKKAQIGPLTSARRQTKDDEVDNETISTDSNIDT